MTMFDFLEEKNINKITEGEQFLENQLIDGIMLFDSYSYSFPLKGAAIGK